MSRATGWSDYDHSVSKIAVSLMDVRLHYRMTSGRMAGDNGIVPDSLMNVTNTSHILWLAL